jgi:adenosylhomocysteine nucleosidase
MPMEVKPLVRKLSLRKTAVGGVTLRTGQLDGGDVVAIVTGMGTKLATEGLELLLDAMHVDRVVVVGITGALEDATPIGTLVVPDVVVDGASGEEFTPARMGGPEPSGKMWTSDKMVTGADDLARLRQAGVVSLDMETAAIARACVRRGIPWSVFRAISDRASDGSVNEDVFHLSNQDGTPNWAAIARFFLTHPSRIPGMAKMAQGARAATENAADAAIHALAQCRS